MSFTDDMIEQTRELSTIRHPESKASIIRHFKETHQNGWKREAASRIAGTKDAKSKEYKSAIRNFQGKRLNEVGDTKKWKELGKTLPPEIIPPSQGYQITFKGYIRISGLCYPRSFVVQVTGVDAEELVRHGNPAIMLTAYWNGKKNNPSEGICEEYPYTLVVS